MSGLPSFFQHRGTTVLDELADYELGGLEEDDDILDDGALETEEESSNIEEPYFQSTNIERSLNIENLNIGSSNASNVDLFPIGGEGTVDLSNLLNNFSWPGKGIHCS
jgi:hypothetical protein